jgi:hypothetical protein
MAPEMAAARRVDWLDTICRRSRPVDCRGRAKLVTAIVDPPPITPARASTTQAPASSIPIDATVARPQKFKHIIDRTDPGYLDMMAPADARAIAAFGDSITDGTASTMNGDDRWPDVLARRLHAVYGNKVAVVNAGIGGNQVVGPAE